MPVYIPFWSLHIHRIHLGRLLNVQENLCAISCNQNTLCLECELHPEIRSFLPNGCVMPSLLCRCQLLCLSSLQMIKTYL